MEMLGRIRKMFGDAFVSYVLSLPDLAEGDDPQLSSVQQEVVDFIGQVFDHVDGAATGTDPDAIYLMSPLARYDQVSGVPMLAALRQHAGGEIPTVDSVGDEFCDLMLGIARDCFPLLLVNSNDMWPMNYSLHISTGLYHHPKLEAVVAAFKADQSLSKLFPFADPDAESTAASSFPGMGDASYVLTNGPGGTLQLSILISQIVGAAAVRCLVSGRRIEWDILREGVIQSISDLRDLADRKAVPAPTLVGLAGVTLPEGTVLSLPDGRIRPVVQSDRDLFPRVDGLSAVYETSFEVVIYDVAPNEFDESDPFALHRKFDDRINASHREFTRSVDLMRLGLLLASPSSDPWSVREVSRLVVNGLFSGGHSWNPGAGWLAPHELSEASFPDAQKWVQVVGKKHVPPMNIGMRRILSASTARTDQIDSFVDAVICWESLFGASTETVFRVTGAIAKLVEKDNPEARDEMIKELKKLYEARSRLVHGGAEPKPVDIQKYRKRAIEVAVECLRRLYGDRFDLLDMTSQERGSRILLE